MGSVKAENITIALNIKVNDSYIAYIKFTKIQLSVVGVQFPYVSNK